ncbi:BspA family leucine-rich repeat surface protein [Lactobacillus sp. ESL0791]|uniref:SLAP domain-containing protein n=1 Tax=Lactobacillus sp. ESL0791 TaxID=2983234 RepID=UPI0023F632FB|nr:BspA family leucine-rich repeat surface protein [Lactobacillus sp. ESL0791]MDF7639199.1 BspA family leucine-rich repeat surface protein [Lactobacillus sp. ESL0791]
MTSKNNQNERLRKISMENKRDRFSIRKLAVGAASILLGFSFMAASGQIAKADTTDPNSQETSVDSRKQTVDSEKTETAVQDKGAAATAKVSSVKKSKTDVTTYSGLHDFLRDGSEETEQTEGQGSSAPSSSETEQTEGQGSSAPSSSETENTNPEQETGAEQTQPASAEDLANAASDLQTEIGKGNDFVKTDPYKEAAADKQKSVTDAIAQGQATLDKYNKFISTNDDKFKVSLFDLTDAKVTIGAMITAATNTVGAQTITNIGDDDGWHLDYSETSSGDATLIVTKANNSYNGVVNDSTTLYDYLISKLGTTNGRDLISKIKVIEFDEPRDSSGNAQLTLAQSGTNFDGNAEIIYAPDDTLHETPLNETSVAGHGLIKYGQLGHFKNLIKIKGLENVDIGATAGAGLSYLFSGDTSLTELNLSNFDTSHVTNMEGMFDYDIKLQKLNLLGKFSTNNVTNMSNMFAYNCSLTDLNLTNFKTDSVSDMNAMFKGNSKLQTLNLGSAFKTGGVKDMSYMFANNNALTTITTSAGNNKLDFNTGIVKDMSYMFFNDSSLSSLDLGANFNTSYVGQGSDKDTPVGSPYHTGNGMASMFYGMAKLKTLNLGSQFDTRHVKNMSNMFSGDSALQSLSNTPDGKLDFDTSGIDNTVDDGTGIPADPSTGAPATPGVTGLYGMFTGDAALTSLKLGPNFQSHDIKNMGAMFNGDKGLKELTFDPNFKGVAVSGSSDAPNDMSTMFKGLSSLKSLDLSNFVFPSFINVDDMLIDLGDPEYFELTLPAEKIPNTWTGTTVFPTTTVPEAAGIGQFSSYDPSTSSRNNNTSKGYIRAVHNASGGGNVDDPQGNSYTGSAINNLYNSTGPGDTYIIAAGANNKTYLPDSSVTLTLHAGQKTVDKNLVNSKLNFIVKDPLTNEIRHKYSESQLESMQDKLAKSKHVIESTEWQPNKDLDDPSVASSNSLGMVSNGNNIVTTAGDIITPDPIPNDGTSNKYALLKINYGDGTVKYIKVTFDVKGAKAKSSTKFFTSSLTPILANKPYTFSNNDVVSDYIDLSNINGQPVAQPTSYSVSATASGTGDVDIKWSETGSSSDFQPGGDHGEVDAQRKVYVTVNYADNSKQGIFPINVPIKSMEKVSPLTSINNQQTYPTAKSTNLITNIKANAISQDSNITDVVWSDGPTLTQVGTQSASVKVSYADNSYKILPVLVQVIAQPKPGIYDDIAHQGNMGVPQYTDIGNDQQAVNDAAASASVPNGTTASWGDNTLPDTNSKGDKGYHFINVTYPDGTATSIPINVNVGNANIKDITLKHNAYIYGVDGKRANGITLKAGSTVTTYGTKLINGREFYLTKDADYYLAAGNDKPAERNLVQDANAYNKKGKKLKTVKHAGTRVKTYGAPILIKGKEYYSIGKNRYISKDSFPPTSDSTLPGLNKGSLSTTGSRMRLKKNTYLYDEKGQRANSLILKSGSIIQTHGSIQINGKSYYAVETGEYINAKNVDENWLG